MSAFLRPAFRWRAVPSLTLLIVLLLTLTTGADDKKSDKLAEPITQGQRVYTCGHSFHVFVPGILADLAKKAEIMDHVQVGMSSIGGSRVIQHWDVGNKKLSIEDLRRIYGKDTSEDMVADEQNLA